MNQRQHPTTRCGPNFGGATSAHPALGAAGTSMVPPIGLSMERDGHLTRPLRLDPRDPAEPAGVATDEA